MQLHYMLYGGKKMIYCSNFDVLSNQDLTFINAGANPWIVAFGSFVGTALMMAAVVISAPVSAAFFVGGVLYVTCVGGALYSLYGYYTSR